MALYVKSALKTVSAQSTLSYLSAGWEPSLPASGSFLDATTEVGERQGWASNGGSVCMCVHFSLLNQIPRPNRTDFWNIQGEIAHAFALLQYK